MRLAVILSCLALAGAACSGSKRAGNPPSGGDTVAGGDPTTGADAAGGDPTLAAVPPAHTSTTSAAGAAASPNFKARLRIGGPLPAGAAAGSDKTFQSTTP